MSTIITSASLHAHVDYGIPEMSAKLGTAVGVDEYFVVSIGAHWDMYLSRAQLRQLRDVCAECLDRVPETAFTESQS